MKAADITDDAFLNAVDEACRLRTEQDAPSPWPWTYTMATRWDVAALLAGHPEDVGMTPREYPNMPAKVVMAKAKKLINRGLMDGCPCGCRGDFKRVAT